MSDPVKEILSAVCVPELVYSPRFWLSFIVFRVFRNQEGVVAIDLPIGTPSQVTVDCKSVHYTMALHVILGGILSHDKCLSYGVNI